MQYKQHAVYIVDPSALRVEVNTEQRRRVALPSLAGRCETPIDGNAIDAAAVVVGGGEWSPVHTRTRTVRYIEVHGIATEIPDGYELIQRTIGDTYTQYAFVRTTHHSDDVADIIKTTQRTTT